MKYVIIYLIFSALVIGGMLSLARMIIKAERENNRDEPHGLYLEQAVSSGGIIIDHQ